MPVQAELFYFQLLVSGGTPPFLWYVIIGSLPPGITLNVNTGVLSGTPTASGIYNSTIRAIDDDSVTFDQSITIEVCGVEAVLIVSMF